MVNCSCSGSILALFFLSLPFHDGVIDSTCFKLQVLSQILRPYGVQRHPHFL